MSNVKISLIFDILEEFIKYNKVSVIEGFKAFYPKRLILVLVDSLGLKEYTYLSKNNPFFGSNSYVALHNPYPSTKLAYKLMFFRGKSSIPHLLTTSQKKFAIIDNKIELSLLGNNDNLLKIHRKNDEYALNVASELASKMDIVWIHLMQLDHYFHQGVRSARKFLLNLGGVLEHFIQTLPPETLCLIFGDHGKHHLDAKSKGYSAKSPKEKKEFYRALRKMHYYAEKTVLCPFFL